jgi:hypothetical protein
VATNVHPSVSGLAIENVGAAINQIAQTTLRKVVGQHTLDQTLSETNAINLDIRKILDAITVDWGVEVTLVELKDIQLPESMKRAMARQAEAEREKRAKIINAEGESLAAAALGEARRPRRAPRTERRRRQLPQRSLPRACPGSSKTPTRASILCWLPGAVSGKTLTYLSRRDSSAGAMWPPAEEVAGQGPGGQFSPGTTTTGQRACCTTWLLTEPCRSRANPPAPRDPTTTRSASPDASINSFAGYPATARTATDAGRDSPSWLITFCVSSSAVSRMCSSSAVSPARTVGFPVHGLAGTEWTVITVSAAFCRAASLTAHSMTRAEWAEPSMPAMIPDIVFLLMPGHRLGDHNDL